MWNIDKNGKNLKEFIDENHYLLSSMAILIALATFGINLSINWIGSILSFLSIAAIATIWVELYKMFPQKGTLRLILFKNILSLGLLTIGFYWVLAFPVFWNIFSFVPLFIFLLYMLHSNIKQFMSIPFIARLFGVQGKRNLLQKALVAFYAGAIFITLIWIFSLSVGATPAINTILEAIRVNFK